MLPSELSDDLAVTRANISNLLSALEQAGRIKREMDTTNRRRIFVRLTPDGHDVISKVWPVYEQTITQNVGSKLNLQELEQLKGLLKKLF
nr:transcriptional regulator [Paenibacillus psychroresistens]